MKSKLYFLQLLLGAILIAAPSSFAQKGKGNGKGKGNVEAYSITSQALRGAEDTEVTVFVATDNSDDFPIPDVLKNLQLKIRNVDGDVVYNKNFQNLQITDSKVIVTVTEPVQHNTLEVLAHIKTKKTVDTEVLKTETPVLLRPDLIIESLIGPAEQQTNTPFNIEAVVKEVNLQVGATASVSLFLGEDQLGQIDDVIVSPGNQVSVVFVGLTHPTEELAVFTAVISNAMPTEFDESNNSKELSVSFVNPIQVEQTTYYFGYDQGRDYEYHDYATLSSNGQLVYEYFGNQDWDNLYYSTYYYGSISSSGQPISADYKIEKSNGDVLSGSFTDVPVSSYYYYYGYYYFEDYDPVNNVWFYAWDDYYYNYSGSQISRYQSNGIYFYYSYNGGTSYYEYTDPISSFINEPTELKVSLVTTIDGVSYGGGATLAIVPFQHYSYSDNYTYYDYSFGQNVNYWYSYSYDYSYSYSDGLTDPTMLPKAGMLETTVLSDNQFGLDKVYQNGQYATIDFNLSEDAPYTLEIMDMSGRKSLRVEEGHHEAGWQTKQLDISSLKSGIYILILQSGQQVETRKVYLD